MTGCGECDERLTAALELATDALVVFDANGCVERVNAAAERLLGVDRRTVTGVACTALVEETSGPAGSTLGSAMAARLPASGVIRMRNGAPARYELRFAEGPASGAAIRLAPTSSTEESLRENEARYRRLFHDSPTALCEQDFSQVKAYLDELSASGVTDLPQHLRSHPEIAAAAARRIRFTEVNDATLAMYEAESREEILKNWPRLFDEEMLKVFVEELCFLLEGKASLFAARTSTRTLRGRRNEIAFRLTVLPGSERTWSRLVASIFDMTAYHEAERKLHAALREKDVLLKEVHHRVKNNLQVISSLLNLQAQYVEDESTRAVFASSQSRVQSIALVHEKLHQSRELSHVRLGDYLKTLVGELLLTHGAAKRGIASIIDVADLSVSVDVAIPCGLIVNELVTNALKHAFPARTAGTLAVRAIRAGETSAIELSVADDGIGLPPRDDAPAPSSLGLDLVFTFAEQLGAEVEIARDGGTTFVFRFRRETA